MYNVCVYLGLLDVLCSGWVSLHPRARQSILALALSTLRASQFKLEPAQVGLLHSQGSFIYLVFTIHIPIFGVRLLQKTSRRLNVL